jgi:4'-phosphopantetheinyl transferase EntD
MSDVALPRTAARRASRLAAVLPDGVVAVESNGDLSAARLLPEEVESLGHVAEGREREFTQARHCARLALASFGADRWAVRIGDGRRPLWPSGMVGSITHCRGYCAAAVAPRARFAGVGIDAELHDVLPRGVLSLTTLPEERCALAALPDVGVCWDRVLFSAKESVFKIWYPLMQSWLGFGDARIRFDPDPHQPRYGAFEAELLAAPLLVDGVAIAQLDGRYFADDGHVLTGIACPARPRPIANGPAIHW